MRRAEGPGAARRLRRVCARAAAGATARHAVRGLPRARAVVARRLRPVPGAARRARRPLLARLGRRAPRSPTRSARRRPHPPRVAGPLLPVRAVDRRHAVAAGASGVRNGRDFRRFPVHGERPQRRRVGAPARVPPRRLGRGAGRGRPRRHRTGGCRPIAGRSAVPKATAGWPSGPSAAPSCSTRSGSIISSASTGPTPATAAATASSRRETSPRRWRRGRR